jgi:hypothetical protein
VHGGCIGITDAVCEHYRSPRSNGREITMTAVTFPNTVSKLLAAGGSSWTMPTTRAGVDKRLEAIAAGKGARIARASHPYASCFGATGLYYRETCKARHEGESCAEYIAQREADKLEQRASA